MATKRTIRTSQPKRPKATPSPQMNAAPRMTLMQKFRELHGPQLMDLMTTMLSNVERDLGDRDPKVRLCAVVTMAELAAATGLCINARKLSARTLALLAELSK